MALLTIKELNDEIYQAKKLLKKLPTWKLSARLQVELRLKQLQSYVKSY